MTIQLTDAAKYYKEESHQIAAWNYLQSELSAEQLDEFAVIYRAGRLRLLNRQSLHLK